MTLSLNTLLKGLDAKRVPKKLDGKSQSQVVTRSQAQIQKKEKKPPVTKNRDDIRKFL